MSGLFAAAAAHSGHGASVEFISAPVIFASVYTIIIKETERLT